MIDYTLPLVQALADHAGDGCILDTNLLLLVLVHDLEPSLLPICDKTLVYSGLWPTIEQALGILGPVYVLPNVATEVLRIFRTVKSVGHLGMTQKQMEAWAKARTVSFINMAEAVEECYVPSKETIAEARFHKLGLSDTGIIRLSRIQNRLVFTGDKDLSKALEQEGLPVFNIWNLVGAAVAAGATI